MQAQGGTDAESAACALRGRRRRGCRSSTSGTSRFPNRLICRPPTARRRRSGAVSMRSFLRSPPLRTRKCVRPRERAGVRRACAADGMRTRIGGGGARRGAARGRIGRRIDRRVRRRERRTRQRRGLARSAVAAVAPRPLRRLRGAARHRFPHRFRRRARTTSARRCAPPRSWRRSTTRKCWKCCGRRRWSSVERARRAWRSRATGGWVERVRRRRRGLLSLRGRRSRRPGPRVGRRAGAPRAAQRLGPPARRRAKVSYFMYRYLSRESCSQFDSLPLTSLTIFLHLSTSDSATSAAASLGASVGRWRASDDVGRRSPRALRVVQHQPGRERQRAGGGRVALRLTANALHDLVGT